MTVKPSTIAMAVVTCGLFGVATWRHLGGDDTPAATSCADESPEIAAEIAEHFAKEAAIKRLVAPQVRPGPVFAAVEVGTPVAETVRAQLIATVEELGFAIQVDTAGDDLIDAIHVTVAGAGAAGPPCEADPRDPCSCYAAPDAHRLCDVLDSIVIQAWGSSTEYGDQKVWFDPEGQRRMRLDDCTLTFERAVSPAAWIGRAPQSVIPLDAIGKPARELGTRANELRSKSELRWTGPGIAIGSGQTRLAGYLDEGANELLIGLRATGEIASGAMYDQLAQQISEVAGAVPTPIGRLLTWTGKVPITLGWEPGANGQSAAFTLDAGSSAAFMIARAKAP